MFEYYIFLKYILHCKIDCTPIAVASCFIFIFYTAFSLTAAAPIPHCGKVFEEGYTVKVKGSKYKWDLVNKNNVSVSAYVSNEIELNYNERTHVHTSSDKCDSDLPMKFHHFGEYNACIGRYKHMIRFCKDCGYEDEKSQSSIFH